MKNSIKLYSSSLVKGFDMYSLYPRKDYVRIVSHTEGALAVRLRFPAPLAPAYDGLEVLW